MSDMDNTSPAPEGAGTPNPTSKMARRRARELALQGVYQWLLSANTMATVQRHLESETENLDKIDRELFVSLLRGAIGGADELRGHFEPLLSRPLAELSPIEHAILLLGAYELHQNIDTPYRVVINEAIEIAKRFGADHGHTYVNGVLDHAALEWRAAEARSQRPTR